MNDARRILLLAATTANAHDIATIVESLSAQGAIVVVRDAGGDCDALLDDIAEADAVISWR